MPALYKYTDTVTRRHTVWNLPPPSVDDATLGLLPALPAAVPRGAEHRRALGHDGRPRRRDSRRLDGEGFTENADPRSSAEFGIKILQVRSTTPPLAPAWGSPLLPADPSNAVRRCRRRCSSAGRGRRADGRAGAGLRRCDRGRRARPRCRWPRTTSAAGTRWSRPPPPATSTRRAVLEDPDLASPRRRHRQPWLAIPAARLLARRRRRRRSP